MSTASKRSWKTATKPKASTRAKRKFGMTLNEFFRYLRKTSSKYHWYLSAFDRVRGICPGPSVFVNSIVCPITAVCLDRTHAFNSVSEPGAAGKKMGLNAESQWLILGAADFNMGHNKAIRKRLLRAVGLPA